MNFMPDTLSNENVQLRVATPSDALQLHNLFDKNRDLFEEFDEDTGIFTTVQSAEKFLTAIQNSPRQKYYLVQDNNGRFAGVLNVWNYDPDAHACELGFCLDADFVGCGLMTAAINLVVQQFFAGGGNRIEICTAAENIRAVNTAIRCGFVHEGLLHNKWFLPHKNRNADVAIFAKLAD